MSAPAAWRPINDFGSRMPSPNHSSGPYFFLVANSGFRHSERVRSDGAVQGEKPLRHFATTRWSLIRNGLGIGVHSDDDNLSQLCGIYWRPVFAFICRRGYSPSDAEDLTQDFFLLLLESNLLQSADPTRGRFRSLLITTLKNFLIDDQDRRRALKRGGDLQFVSWERWTSETTCCGLMSHEGREPSCADAFFDLSWAHAVAEEALRRLRMECESKGRRRVYEVLNRYLASDRADISYKDLSGELGISETSVRNLLHQFRRRYRGLLREEVARTVQTNVDIEDEIRYLCATLSAQGG